MTDSTYTMPIFISSTDYDLVDLRHELSDYLTKLGYKPILSSLDGFHDCSPNLEPWESCLVVLENSFVIILVVDRRYGRKMKWPHYEKVFDGREVSPTHGEYLFAHKTKKRILVFIREEILTYYQVYRNVTKNYGENEIQAVLGNSIPPQIDVDVFRLIEEIKTTRPIPWIKTFKSVLDIKNEIKLKMINELAEVYMVKSNNLEIAMKIIGQALETMDDDKKSEFLKNTPIEKIIEVEKRDLEEKSKALIEINKRIEDKAEKDCERLALEKEKLQEEIIELNERLKSSKSYEGKAARLADYLQTGCIGISGAPASSHFVPITTPSAGFGSVNLFSIAGATKLDRCEKCFLPIETASAYVFVSRCPKCGKRLCEKCWPRSVVSLAGYQSCPECSGGIGTFSLLSR